MEAKKYLINPRGRRLRPVSEKEAEPLLRRGFTEVSREVWEEKDYFVEFDKGVTFAQPVTPTEPRAEVTERKSFKTIVI